MGRDPEGPVSCGWCDGTGVVFGIVGTDEDGCPIRDATGCDMCGGSERIAS